MEENKTKEFEFFGGSLNGFLMCFIAIILWGCAIFSLISGIIAADAERSCAGWFVTFALLVIIAVICSCGFTRLEPNEAKVMTFFGKYVGTFRKNGFYWLNPLMSSKKVSLRARNLNADPIKVNDKAGNPVLIGLVLVWRLKDTYKAIFDIDTDVSANAQIGNAAGARIGDNASVFGSDRSFQRSECHADRHHLPADTRSAAHRHRIYNLL